MMRNVWLDISSLKKCVDHTVQFSAFINGLLCTMQGEVVAVLYGKGKLLVRVIGEDGLYYTDTPDKFGL